MHTLMHTESSLGWGGQELRLLKEAQGLRERGWRVIIACQPDSGTLREGAKAGFDCFPIKMPSSVNLAAVLQLRNLFLQEKVELVTTHSSIDSWLTGWAALLCPQKPIVVRVRHLSGGVNTRFVYTHLCDAIVAVSHEVKRHMAEERRINANKIHVIFSGIDTAKYKMAQKPTHLRSEWGVEPDDKLIGTISVLRNKKGHRFLIRAAGDILKEHPNTKFLFVGSGPKEQEIKEEINKLGLEKYFILAGARKDIPEIVNSMDIFVFPSQAEAMGQAPMEAMAAGLPVVSSKVGGLPELIVDGETGYLIPHSDPQALAVAINKLLNAPQLAQKMGRAGQERVQKIFDNKNMLDSTEQLYKQLLQKT